MKSPSTPKQKPKPSQLVLDLVRSAKEKLAEKRNGKFSARTTVGVKSVGTDVN